MSSGLSWWPKCTKKKKKKIRRNVLYLSKIVFVEVDQMTKLSPSTHLPEF